MTVTLPMSGINSLPRPDSLDLPDTTQGPDAARLRRDVTAALIEARNWLNVMIPTEQSVLLMIDRTMAHAMLDRNQKNRILRQEHLKQLIKDHREGRMVRTADAIAFDSDGWLQNGQHRLTAIERTGISCKFRVEFGLPPESLSLTDNGSKRNNGDAVHIKGIRNGKQVASAVSWAVRLEDGLTVNSHFNVLKADQVLAGLERLDGIVNCLPPTGGFSRRFRVSLGMVAALHWHFAKAVDIATASAFFDKCVSTEGVAEDDPRWQLHLRMVNNLHPRDRMGYFEFMALIVKAWNKWVRGETIRQLRMIEGEKFPAILGRKRSFGP